MDESGRINQIKYTSLLICILLVSCGRNSDLSAESEENLFQNFALAESSNAPLLSDDIPAIWLDSTHALIGEESFTLSTKNETPFGENTQKIIAELQKLGKNKKLALGVDKRAPFQIPRAFFKEFLKTNIEAVALRVGEKSGKNAINVCLVGQQDLPNSESPDCWSRSVNQPNDSKSINSRDSVNQNEKITTPASKSGGGDISESSDGPRWNEPLYLAISLENDYMMIRVQKNLIRTLRPPVSKSKTYSDDMIFFQKNLDQTLKFFRNHNTWEQRVFLRVSDDYQWGSLIKILDTLTENRFGSITLTHINEN